MLIPSDCIALRVVPYSDSRSIVSFLSREAGHVSVIVNFGASRSARRRRALMMPGSVFHTVIDSRANRSLQSIGEVMPVLPLAADHPVKAAIALFLCDFVNALLRESPTDPILFDYILSFLRRLNAEPSPHANSVICFLVGLTSIMGIAPDLASWAPGRCFDFSAGTFRPPHQLINSSTLNSSTHQLINPQQSVVAARLARMTPRNMHLFRFSRADRAETLDLLLQYFATHFGTSVTSLRSLSILHSLFD